MLANIYMYVYMYVYMYGIYKVIMQCVVLFTFIYL